MCVSHENKIIGINYYIILVIIIIIIIIIIVYYICKDQDACKL